MCHLLLAVFGDPSDRLQLLVNAHGVLVPGGSLFASFSGRSDDVNPEYARSYREDGSYRSRDERGNVLYRTHHFREDEVLALLEAAGFSGIEIQERIESSSRRPDQNSRFLYAMAVKDRGSGIPHSSTNTALVRDALKNPGAGVLAQDGSNMETMQAGVKSDSFKGMLLSDEDLRLRHFHQTIDAFIAGTVHASGT